MSDPSRPTENPVISELDQLPDRDREETAEWRASSTPSCATRGRNGRCT